jgi:hypothetical protein
MDGQELSLEYKGTQDFSLRGDAGKKALMDGSELSLQHKRNTLFFIRGDDRALDDGIQVSLYY